MNKPHSRRRAINTSPALGRSKIRELAATVRYAAYRYPDGYRISRILAELTSTQWLSREQLAAFRREKLRLLLAHAARYVPFYKEFAENGLPPTTLAQLPVIRKEDLRRHPADFQCEIKGRSRPGSTGGSTGEPLGFLMDLNSLAWTEAAWLRGRAWAGVQIGDRGAIIGASKISLRGYLRRRIVNLYPLLAIGPADLPSRNLLALRRIRPKSVNSFASVLVALAEAARDQGITDLEIPVMFSSGEKLFPHQRELIRKFFNSDIRDCYGSNEVGGIAYECEEGRLHVSNEHVIVEVLDDRGEPVQDQVGRIVLTDLDNFVMPFIRYDIGDMGVLSSQPCPCGRGLEVLESIEGREQEFLVDSRGGKVPAIFFPCQFRDLRHVAQYQIVQETRETVILRFVPKTANFATELDWMIGILRQTLGRKVEVRVRQESSIEQTPHGKTKYVVSKVEWRNHDLGK